MHAFKFMGIYAIVPMTIFLTIAFFVQLAIRKLDSKGLRRLGLVIVGLLWLCAALYLSKGIYSISMGKCFMLQKIMKSPMQRQMMESYKSGETTK